MDQLGKISPLQGRKVKSKAATAASDKLKYSYLVQIINRDVTTKTPCAIEAVIGKERQAIENILRLEKFLTPAKEVTPLGRRFEEDFEALQEQEK